MLRLFQELLRRLRPPLNFGEERVFEEPVGEERVLFEDLIAKALKGSLDPLQQKKVLLELENDPKLVYNCGLAPKKLPDLVENNPQIAVEVLINLMNSPEILEYFGVLVNLGTGLNQMEVVNRLIVAVGLPTEILNTFISHCMTSLRGIKDRNELQLKLVRLLCVSTISLIHNKLINVDDIFMEAEAFCMEFLQITDARILFRLLE